MSERRVAILFGVVVVFLLALLTVQEPQRAGDLVLWVEGPVKQVVAAVAETVDRARRGRVARAEIERENVELRERVRELEAAYAASVGARLESDLVSKQLRYEPPADADLLLADVVYVDHHSFRRRTAILRLPAGARREDWSRKPVTTAEGLLGRVVSSGGGYARVLLVTDRDSSVGAMVERTRRQGIVRGVDAAALSLMFLPLQVDVRPGDRVITAGIDGVFPRGIPIGTIASVESGGDPFHAIRVVPSVDLGSLSHAYIWHRDPVPEVYMDGGDGVSQ